MDVPTTAESSCGASLVEILAREREQIIRDWMARVKNDERIPSSDRMDRFVLRDDMPGILRQIAISVGRHITGDLGFDDAALAAAESTYTGGHLRSRLRYGYQLPEALREYAHLRGAIIETWTRFHANPSGDELELLHAALDEIIVSTATQILERNLAAKDLFLSKLSNEQISPDLQELSKIVLGRFRLKLDECMIASILSHAYETAKPAADAKKISLQLDLEDGHEAVLIDELKIHQALMNMINNAIRSTHSGGQITLGVRAAGDVLYFTVSDNGKGIDPSHLPTLFDWQSATKSSTRGQSGPEIGLSIAKEIAELHDGDLVAESGGLGKGAKLTLTVPRRSQLN